MTHLPHLLDRVAKGEQITITRHGVPVARLVPVEPHRHINTRQAIADLRRLRENRRPGAEKMRDMVREARRH